MEAVFVQCKTIQEAKYLVIDSCHSMEDYISPSVWRRFKEKTVFRLEDGKIKGYDKMDAYHNVHIMSYEDYKCNILWNKNKEMWQ